MPIQLYFGRERDALRVAGRVAANTLQEVCKRVKSGITTSQIDEWVRHDTKERGGTPSQLGYQGFPAAVCTSVNRVVCHGIPSKQQRLVSGDIVNIDVTTKIDGFHGDTSRTVMVGSPSAEAKHVTDVAKRCLHAGIAKATPGGRLGDIGAAIQELAESEGCSVVSALGGHGIGRRMHQEPHVHHTGVAGTGVRLKPGMAFTIEPMINLGRSDVKTEDDGWTITTVDDSLSAQFEHTLLVTEGGIEVLTALPDAERG